MAVISQFGNSFFTGERFIKKYRFAYPQSYHRQFLPSLFGPVKIYQCIWKNRFTVSNGKWKNRQVVTVGHCKNTFFKRPYRPVKIKPAAFGVRVYPFFSFPDFVKSLIKIFY